MTRYVFLTLLLFLSTRSNGQIISKAYCGEDGNAHITYVSGKSVDPTPQPKQVGCANIAVAMDGHTVGWTVLVENCCTSYPIPTSLMVMKNGRSTALSY